jgi:hypothetical protein
VALVVRTGIVEQLTDLLGFHAEGFFLIMIKNIHKNLALA